MLQLRPTPEPADDVGVDRIADRPDAIAADVDPHASGPVGALVADDAGSDAAGSFDALLGSSDNDSFDTYACAVYSDAVGV